MGIDNFLTIAYTEWEIQSPSLFTGLNHTFGYLTVRPHLLDFFRALIISRHLCFYSSLRNSFNCLRVIRSRINDALHVSERKGLSKLCLVRWAVAHNRAIQGGVVEIALVFDFTEHEPFLKCSNSDEYELLG